MRVHFDMWHSGNPQLLITGNMTTCKVVKVSFKGVSYKNINTNRFVSGDITRDRFYSTRILSVRDNTIYCYFPSSHLQVGATGTKLGTLGAAG